MSADIYIETGRPQRVDRVSQMSPIPGLDDDLEQYRLGRQISEDAMVGHLYDVGACLAQDCDDGGKLTGSIRLEDPNVREV